VNAERCRSADHVTAVLATYNEASTICEILGRLERLGIRSIVVDDSSPDGTGAIAASFSNTTVVTRSRKLGIASAYIEGLRFALENSGAPYVVQMDAGLTHDPNDVPHLVDAMERGYDLVIGSRFASPGFPFFGYRTLISLQAAAMMRCLGVRVRDATSGFRCWRADFLRTLLLDVELGARGFAFQIELLYGASRRGRISEVPIRYLLTNSTFNRSMLMEAAAVFARLARRHRGNR
jgi:dolichol-phosphate mannosyltransferase